MKKNQNRLDEGLHDEDQQDDIPEILIVEDNEDARWLIVSELQDEYRILESDNGQDGLKKALEEVPDLVVTDIMMPVMDGVELCRRLKTSMLTSHIPVVMLTAKASVESQIEGLETGADDYVTKPFNIALLKARIRNLLEVRRQLRRRYSEMLTESESPSEPRPEMPDSLNRIDREFWNKICDVLQAHYAEIDFGIDAWADKVGISRRSLQRKIKALSGQTPVQMITEYRLKESVCLLSNKSIHITDIAYDVGFGDLSYFNRLFKKKYSMSPSQYRETRL